MLLIIGASFTYFLSTVPDKLKQIATKAPSLKAKPLVDIHICVFMPWWQKCFAITCKKITTKILIGSFYFHYFAKERQTWNLPN